MDGVYPSEMSGPAILRRLQQLGITPQTVATILNNGNDADNQQIKNLANGSDGQDAVTLQQLLDAISGVGANPDLDDVLNQGNDGNGAQIKNIADGSDDQDAITLLQLNNAISGVGPTNPGGEGFQIQFNDGGAFGGTPQAIYKNDNLGVGYTADEDLPEAKLSARGNVTLGANLWEDDWVLGTGWTRSFGALNFAQYTGLFINSFAVLGVGSGYQSGDIFTLVGGNDDAQGQVDSVGGGGEIETFHINNAGTGGLVMDTEYQVTGGAGTGASFRLEKSVYSNLAQQGALTDGTRYRVKVKINNSGVGSIDVYLGGTLLGSFSGNAVNVVAKFSPSFGSKLLFIPTDDWSGNIEAIVADYNTIEEYATDGALNVDGAATLVALAHGGEPVKVLGLTGTGIVVLKELDTDGALTLDSDFQISSQKAVKAYVDDSLAPVIDDIADINAGLQYPLVLMASSPSINGNAGGTTNLTFESGVNLATHLPMLLIIKYVSGTLAPADIAVSQTGSLGTGVMSSVNATHDYVAPVYGIISNDAGDNMICEVMTPSTVASAFGVYVYGIPRPV